MIALTRLNGHPVMVNSDLIEQIEETPDTVVTLTSGNRLIVRDRMLEIQQKIIDFKGEFTGQARRFHWPAAKRASCAWNLQPHRAAAGASDSSLRGLDIGIQLADTR